MSKRKDIERAESGKAFRSGELLEAASLSKSTGINIMGIAKGLISKIKSKEQLTPTYVEQLIAPTIEKQYRNASLVQLAKTIRASIGVVGVNVVRTKIISVIEDDVRRTKNEPIEREKMIQTALATPEYMVLLKDLGLDENNIREIESRIINGG